MSSVFFSHIFEALMARGQLGTTALKGPSGRRVTILVTIDFGRGNLIFLSVGPT